MSGFTKGPAKVNAEGHLCAESADGVPVSGVAGWAQRRDPWNDDWHVEGEANRDLLCVALNAATALDAAGYDAMKAMEALPGLLEWANRVQLDYDGWAISRATGNPDTEAAYAQRLSTAVFSGKEILATIRAAAKPEGAE